MLTLGDVRKADLRVAQITRAERIPKTERLLMDTVDLGTEERNLVAGRGGHFAPEDLIGLRVIAVSNLEPAIIRGVESRGMLLGAGCTDRERISLLTVNRADVPNGARVD